MNGRIPPLRVFTMIALTIMGVMYLAAIFAVFWPQLPNLKTWAMTAVVAWLLIAGWRHTLSSKRESQSVNPPAPNPDTTPESD